MHIRCPHCHQPVELVENAPLEQIDCPSCGSQFNLLGEETVDRRTEAGRTIGHFELVERLGMGQFGAVWMAHDTELDRTVAVKIPRQEQLSRGDVEMFLREARAAAQLHHPHIVGVHEVGRDGDTVYIVSDLVQGMTLADRLSAGRLSPREAASLCATIADALQHAHQAGVVHRDLKPSNIMLDADGQPHLMDFGLAKRDSGEITMTMDGRILGTPAYMSPEQARGEAHHADARSDIYSLGTILFELLTGELPFRGNKRMLLMQIIHDEPPSPRKLDAAVSRDLETICLKCLEKLPEQRYGIALEVAADLRRYLAREPIQARPIGRIERGYRWCRRNPALAGSALCVAIILSAGAAASTYFALAERAAKLTAERAAGRERDQSIAAKAERDRADREAAAAVAERKKAEASARDAQAGREAAERQAHRADAIRLASESKLARAEYPQRSAALAIEAAEITRRTGEPIMPAAQEQLYEALDALGGVRIGGDIRYRLGSQLAISADGHWLVTGGSDVRRYDLMQSDPTANPRRLCDRGVWIVGITPDSRKVVAAQAMQKPFAIRILNLADEDPAASAITISGDDQPLSALVISPDSRTLVTRHYDRAAFRIWDLSAADTPASSVTLRPETPKSSPVARPEDAILISPDSHWLIAVAYGHPFAWDLERLGQQTLPVQFRQLHHMNATVMAPDGQSLITGNLGHRAFLWNLPPDSPDPSPRALQLGNAVTPLTTSPDGTWLFAAEDNGNIWRYRWRQNTLRGDLLSGHTGSVAMAHFTSSGRLITTSDDKTVRLWRGATQESGTDGFSSTVLRRHEKLVRSLAASPSGRWLATGSDDGSAWLWDVAGDNPTGRECVLGHEGAVQKVAATADGRWLATASGPTVRLWDLNGIYQGRPPIVLPGHARKITNLTASPDGRWLATASGEASARLWNLSHQDPAANPIMLSGEAPVTTVQFSADSSVLAINGMLAKIWNLGFQQPAMEPLTLNGDGMVDLLAMSADGRRIATAMRNTIVIWDTATEQPEPRRRTPRPFDDPIAAMAISPDGQWVAARSTKQNEPMRLWNVGVDGIHEAVGPVVPTSRLMRQDLLKGSISLDPQGRWLIETFLEFQPVVRWMVRTYDLRAPEPATTVRTLGSGILNSPIDTLSPAFDPQGKWLATQSPTAIHLWNPAADNPSAVTLQTRGFFGELSCLRFSGDGRWLAAAGQDNTIRLWDLHREDPSRHMLHLRGHKARATSLEFSGDNRWLASASDDQTVRLWDLDVDRLIEHVTRSGRQLGSHERQLYHLDHVSAGTANPAARDKASLQPSRAGSSDLGAPAVSPHFDTSDASFSLPALDAAFAHGQQLSIEPVTGRVPGVLEGESLTAKASVGIITVQDMAAFGTEKWSGGKQLCWRGGRPGATLELLLPEVSTGTYTVSAVLTTAEDYGIVQARLDDHLLGWPLNLFSDGDVAPTRLISLGKLYLADGRHRLTLEIVGTHPNSKQQYMVGLDYVLLKAVER